MNEVLLVGWKEISAALGQSVYSARRKYKNSLKTSSKMPIYKNGQVQAYYSELRKWIRSQSRP